MRVVAQYFNTVEFKRIFLSESYRAGWFFFYGLCLLSSAGIDIKEPLWLYAMVCMPAIIAAFVSYKR